ncbi:MAG TPA: ATP-binding cassette domain-containing protein [Gammaproteobacteria bacterium]|nr:ATP-binding cassette domain-containing protein [Gammaproteobacteria bacterium]
MSEQPSAAVPDRVLEVRGATKSYGSNRALVGVDLDVALGEFVALLGPNGAGKTTLFQLLTGLFVPDAGRIVVNGIDLRRHPIPALATIGVVFQQPALDLDLTVRGNLMFHARLHGCGSTARRRVDEALEWLHLSDVGGARARTLSGGNRRKLELARCLIHRPRLLLMDEATVGLDPASRQQLLQRVRDLCRQQHIGVLWATHLVDEAEGADRVIILNRGHKQAEGTPSELLGGLGGSLADVLIALSGENHRTREVGT